MKENKIFKTKKELNEFEKKRYKEAIKIAFSVIADEYVKRPTTVTLECNVLQKGSYLYIQPRNYYVFKENRPNIGFSKNTLAVKFLGGEWKTIYDYTEKYDLAKFKKEFKETFKTIFLAYFTEILPEEDEDGMLETAEKLLNR